MNVPKLTKELLRDLRHRGEATMKMWADAPSEWLADPEWAITYCVENFTRMAAISRVNKRGVDIREFLEAVPDFKEVFGDTHSIDVAFGASRGSMIILKFNHFSTEPFFPRDASREAPQE